MCQKYSSIQREKPANAGFCYANHDRFEKISYH